MDTADVFIDAITKGDLARKANGQATLALAVRTGYDEVIDLLRACGAEM
jgi:hypothetical protein